MNALSAKGSIWAVKWNEHNITLEFLRDKDYCWPVRRYYYYLYIDGKLVDTQESSDFISRTLQGTMYDEREHSVECCVCHRWQLTLQFPPRKSWIGRVLDPIGRVILSDKVEAFVCVDEEMIYSSLIGTKNQIERIKLQHALIGLKQEERALRRGKICVLSSKGRRFERATENELEKAKIRLEQERKKLESRLRDWQAKHLKSNGIQK